MGAYSIYTKINDDDITVVANDIFEVKELFKWVCFKRGIKLEKEKEK